ncbi:MAG: gamma-glutamylcyclotransferase [Ardenticatenaceae bacterium]|nr:gamma-glutamylcyclotransferase [Ardenticatenaceae bacterium]
MKQHKQLPFFVYGTLLPGQPNFFLWGEAIAHMEPATFFGGRLYDMGFYPMMIAAEPETAVHGQLITPHPAEYQAVCQRLDELEGYDPDHPETSDYQRKRVEVVGSNGRSQSAWVYLGQSQFVADKPEVPGGSWAAYVAESQAELQAWWDAIRSVAGRHNKQ